MSDFNKEEYYELIHTILANNYNCYLEYKKFENINYIFIIFQAINDSSMSSNNKTQMQKRILRNLHYCMLENYGVNELREVNENMNETFKKIDLTVENYPDIKANENFIVLQKSVIDAEEHLQAARRLYNASALQYNQLVETFPSIIVGKMLGATTKDFFEAQEETKETVKMEL